MQLIAFITIVFVLSTHFSYGAAWSDVRVPVAKPIALVPNVELFLKGALASQFEMEKDGPQLNFSHTYVEELYSGQRFTILITGKGFSKIDSEPFKCITEDHRVFTIVDLVEYSRNNGTDTTISIEYGLTIQGAILGYSFVKCSLTHDFDGSDDTGRSETWDVLVRVLKTRGIVDVVYDISIYSVSIVSMIIMGSQLDLEVVKKALRVPKALLIGLACQFVTMPLISYATIVMMEWKGSVAVGFFALGCSPGGGMSNLYTNLIGGDLTISVTMTLVSTIAALGFVPMWMLTLGSTLEMEDGATLRIPFENIAISLALAVGPLFIGLFIKFKLRRVAAVISKIMRPLMLLLVLFAYGIGIYANVYIFEWLTATLALAACALPIGGFLIGMFIAYVLKLEWKVIKTVSIETGIQNVVIALIIVQWSLPNPESDLALIPIVASTILGPAPLVVLTIAYTIYTKTKENSKQKGIDAKQAEAEGAEVKEAANSKGRYTIDLETQKSENGAYCLTKS